VKARREVRLLALQALFEVDSSHHLPESVLAHRLEEKALSNDGEAFLRQLVFGVLQHQGNLDRIIESIATDWPLEQMAIVDRNILRLAIYEITIGTGTPVKVAINEAVELAKLFGSDSSRRFVNGVLGALVASHDTAAVAERGSAS
jgi:N utilization substance protein B